MLVHVSVNCTPLWLESKICKWQNKMTNEYKTIYITRRAPNTGYSIHVSDWFQLPCAKWHQLVLVWDTMLPWVVWEGECQWFWLLLSWWCTEEPQVLTQYTLFWLWFKKYIFCIITNQTHLISSNMTLAGERWSLDGLFDSTNEDVGENYRS